MLGLCGKEIALIGLFGVLSTFLPLPLGESRSEGDAAPASVSSVDLTPARPGYVYAFPRDHGAHENYGLELSLIHI